MGLPKEPDCGHLTETPSAFSCGSEAVTCGSEGGVSAGGAGGCSAAERIRLGPSPPRSAAARPAHTRAPSAFCPSLGVGEGYPYGLGNKQKNITGRPPCLTESKRLYLLNMHLMGYF